MGVALPGALGLKLAKSHPNMLAMVGDGAFLMNSQEIETAVRERIAGRADLQHPAGTPTDLAAGPHSRGTVATTA
jgi:hypothetical protein